MFLMCKKYRDSLRSFCWTVVLTVGLNFTFSRRLMPTKTVWLLERQSLNSWDCFHAALVLKTAQISSRLIHMSHTVWVYSISVNDKITLMESWARWKSWCWWTCEENNKQMKQTDTQIVFELNDFQMKHTHSGLKEGGEIGIMLKEEGQ